MAEAATGSVQADSCSSSDWILPSGDESGTAPGDRSFRPDVEGLRAVAVLLVVLFHSGISALSGGFVGVDVFFVISGFVITGVLLRERALLGHTSILAFYGRRSRRIIPAATLVIIVTVALAYHFLVLAAVSQRRAMGAGRPFSSPTFISFRPGPITWHLNNHRHPCRTSGPLPSRNSSMSSIRPSSSSWRQQRG